jgi:2-isopropylmalate synthase
MGMPTATLRLRGPDGALHTRAVVGTGPVHAAFEAVNAIIGVPNTLVEFNIHAVTEGIDAIGEVTVRLQAENGSASKRTSPQNDQLSSRTYGGYGADTDIIVASVKAYLSALNKLLLAKGYFGQAEAPLELQQEMEMKVTTNN